MGEEKLAAGINASSSGKCQQINFNVIVARSAAKVNLIQNVMMNMIKLVTEYS